MDKSLNPVYYMHIKKNKSKILKNIESIKLYIKLILSGADEDRIRKEINELKRDHSSIKATLIPTNKSESVINVSILTQSIRTPNRNGRIYSSSALSEAFKRYEEMNNGNIPVNME